jgi:hypothetical protein
MIVPPMFHDPRADMKQAKADADRDGSAPEIGP